MQLKGIYAPIVTPFNNDESINYEVLKKLIDFVLANGVVGLVPGGTTGEVYALSEEERLELFQFVKDVCQRSRDAHRWNEFRRDA